MKPRILHVTAAQLSRGGVERYLLGLCQNMREDHDLALLSGAEKQFSEQMQGQGCETFFWNVRRAFDVSAAQKLSEVIQSYRADIVHIHDARAGLILRLWPRRTGAKIVRTVHLSSLHYRWSRFNRLRRFAYGGMERIFHTFFTDAVVYPSLRGWEEALHHRYAPPRKAICIPNGIDLRPFESARPKSSRPNAVPVICTVARLSPEKNIGLLLEAAALLGERGCAFQIWVVGDGPQRAALEQAAARLGLADQTRFWGQQEDIASILFQADIFALTSWYEGGRAQAVMEAQAAGLACVLSDVGDNASMADGGGGLLFPEGDAHACADRLDSLLANPQERLAMGENARRKALQAYNLQAMADRYRQVYKTLLEK